MSSTNSLNPFAFPNDSTQSQNMAAPLGLSWQKVSLQNQSQTSSMTASTATMPSSGPRSQFPSIVSWDPTNFGDPTEQASLVNRTLASTPEVSGISSPPIIEGVAQLSQFAATLPLRLSSAVPVVYRVVRPPESYQSSYNAIKLEIFDTKGSVNNPVWFAQLKTVSIFFYFFSVLSTIINMYMWRKNVDQPHNL